MVVCLEPKFVAPSLPSFSLSELTRSPSTVEFPPILAILLSPYSTLLTSLISPSHHAFLSHLHQSTPSRLDRLALSSFQTFQTYPSTLLALPRAALALMLVLGGTGKSFEALEVAEDGLYFMERGGEQELTLYASVVLSVFVGAVWMRVMVLLGAWVVVWRMDRKEGSCGEVEKASGELVVGKGWRGRLEGEFDSVSFVRRVEARGADFSGVRFGWLDEKRESKRLSTLASLIPGPTTTPRLFVVQHRAFGFRSSGEVPLQLITSPPQHLPLANLLLVLPT